MNIEDLTIEQAKELVHLFGKEKISDGKSLNSMISQKVIVRTYSAGVFFGVLAQKEGEEVILKDARRMYYWKAKEGISLSACALYGVHSDSKIIEPIKNLWIKAIEIIPCTEVSIKSLEEAEHVKAQ